MALKAGHLGLCLFVKKEQSHQHTGQQLIPVLIAASEGYSWLMLMKSHLLIGSGSIKGIGSVHDEDGFSIIVLERLVHSMNRCFYSSCYSGNDH